MENGYENGACVSQTDIGVVSPYKLQCKEITRVCRQNNFQHITIGTAEIFQGQEKPVMIVSTVRTDGKLGFVSDPRVRFSKFLFPIIFESISSFFFFFQRFNVVITRAKCLLIVIGDPHTLCLDTHWRALIEYCVQNNALIQGETHFELPD